VPAETAGIAAGHIHLNVSDIAAQQKFWTNLGGRPVTNEKLVMVEFPGVYVILRKQNSTGGTDGSVLGHVGFHVKNMAEWLPKWEAAGIKVERAGNPKGRFLAGPDNVRVEVIEDDSIATPIALHHFHLFVTDPLAVQEWYAKNLGATKGKRAQFDAANIPGVEITLSKIATAQVPTKGRSVDHIGFEVTNLDQFVKKLQAQGIQVEAPGVRTSANASKLRLAYITDPWGTYIELTEGLQPRESASR